jgi:hypothetical protein
LAGRKHLVDKVLQGLEDSSDESDIDLDSLPHSPLIQPKPKSKPREKESPRRPVSTSFQAPMERVNSSAPYAPYTFRLEREVFFFWW